MANSLFISYDGMTDPLGQSQVIPYLAGLVKLGHRITLLSCEKQDNFKRYKTDLEILLKNSNITWIPIPYRKNPPVLSTLMDVRTLTRTAIILHKNTPFDIIHCRSYISALVGLKLKRKFGVKFIFDMRGFWADERVDGKLWNLGNPIFKSVYNYFKKKEIEFLSEADYTISLTKNASDEIHSWKKVTNQPVPIQVIPCCVDLDLFDPSRLSGIEQLRTTLELHPEDFVLTYVGSIGTWYMLPEMLDFFKVLLHKRPTAKFLFVTKDNKQDILRVVQEKEIPQNHIIITSAERIDVPRFIAIADLSIFFIKPVFSKKASSPTKQGEIMAMEVPVICNSNVGDTDYVINTYHSGILVREFTDSAYQSAIDNYDTYQKTSENNALRIGAEEFFSLEKGIDSYHQVYNFLLHKSSD